MDKTSWEETRSKDTLDRKLKLEQGLLDKKEDLQKETNRQDTNREELIKLRVKNSQLDSQKEMLETEKKQLDEGNTKLIAGNTQLELDNQNYMREIATTIQRIDINNLLKEIDIEEIALLAKNNKQMNFSMTNLITKWNAIVAHGES